MKNTTMITNENILLTSFLNGKTVQELPKSEGLENQILKHVIPPISLLPLENKKNDLYNSENYEELELWMNDKAKTANNQFFPLSFKILSEEKVKFTLPWEPLISIESNVRLDEKSITSNDKLFVGSIKDRWAIDDYNITITGAFYGQKFRGSYAECYPRKDMESLKHYLLTSEAIQVECELLQIHGINSIVIYSFSFPFTKGESVQAYEIHAKSDFNWNLNYKRSSLDVGMLSGNFDK